MSPRRVLSLKELHRILGLPVPVRPVHARDADETLTSGLTGPIPEDFDPSAFWISWIVPGSGPKSTAPTYSKKPVETSRSKRKRVILDHPGSIDTEDVPLTLEEVVAGAMEISQVFKDVPQEGPLLHKRIQRNLLLVLPPRKKGKKEKETYEPIPFVSSWDLTTEDSTITEGRVACTLVRSVVLPRDLDQIAKMEDAKFEVDYFSYKAAGYKPEVSAVVKFIKLLKFGSL
ncbi:hypothetical protein NE237_011691 [Protea cynaroides]|uniref:Uncharacterized protein n=1 Tax=Protea cynaroides TaxID=273540 RepID=A0A9Q0GYD2_9MAGN|nr:hypothetical protein NE237_011691 [Protea cynaroides]